MNEYNTEQLRKQFPILRTKVNGRELVYLDNAATTQKPLCVLDASRRYYEEYNSNVHRGAHRLSQIATEALEAARREMASFLGANSSDEVIFTSGCTMGINLVASILGLSGRIREGDRIIVSTTEHHSNIVPWQMLCERTGAVLKVIPLKEDSTWDMDAFAGLLTDAVKIVAVGHVSNALGLVNPVEDVIRLAKENNPETIVLIDGAQSVPHMPVDVKELGCDFYAFSGHKIYAPTGTGALWGRYGLLDMLPPWMGGGEMISEVTFEKTTYNKLPFKYEAGTPNIEGAIAMAEAVRFIRMVGHENIAGHESELTARTIAGLKTLDGVRIIGPETGRSAVISINMDNVHPYDLGTLLDQMGIAVRTGHHCCQPLMRALGVSGTTRISFACYNTEEEVDYLVDCMRRSLKMLM